MAISYTGTKVTCYSGLFVQAIVNNFLPILFIVFQRDYGLSYEELGRLIFINFFIQIFADLATTKIASLLGYKGTAILSQLGAALGLVLLCFTPRIISDIYTAIIIPVFLYAFSSGIMEVILSPMVELLPSKNKGANMAFLHSFYCWGQTCTVIGTTVLLKIFNFSGWSFIPLVWAVIPLINAIFFVFVPVIEPEKKQNGEERKNILKSREFICFVIFMLCAGASEMSMAQWASMFVQQGLGVSKVVGDLLGPCTFGVFMGAGRIVYGMLSGRYSVKNALIFNNILCIICYLLVGICNLPVLSLVACALCGFSVSLSWPGTYSLAASHFGGGTTLMFSIFAFCGDLGCAGGPWILGAVADMAGLQSGFVVSAVFPFIMLIAAAFLLKEKDCIREQ